MRKHLILIVAVAFVASGCLYLKPGAGAFQLEITVGPPGAHGDRAALVRAPGFPDGTATSVEVRLDDPRSEPVATGAQLPFTFTISGDAVGNGTHLIYAVARVDGKARRGLSGFDNRPRLNQLQSVGTHNSYHLMPTDELWSQIEPWQYFESPLAVQLGAEGVRQFELDVNLANDGSGRMDVFHVPIVDELTTCRALVDCLSEIKGWSDAFPGHAPIAVQLELKDNDLGFPVPYGYWHADALDDLDALIRYAAR